MTRTERTYYVVFGLYNLSWSFIGPTYALFLISRGLDLFQINVVLATYLITSFVFEVPTGAVADLFGRKVSFLLSCAIRMAAFAMYAFSNTFPAFLLAEFVDAVGTTLATGALDAWAVDGIRAEGDLRGTERLFGRAQMLSRAAMIASGLTAGYLAEHDLVLPWFAGAMSFAVTGVITAVLMGQPVTAPAVGNDRAPATRASLRQMVHDGLGTVRTTPVLRLLCLLTLATAFGTMPVNMLWQPRMQGLASQGVWLMGWIWAFLNLCIACGSALIPALLRRWRREHVLAGVALWRSLAISVAALATAFFPALGGLLLQEAGLGLSEPLLQAWMNEHVAADRRATVLSVRAMSFTLGGATGLVCLGLVARGFGIPAAWLGCAAVFALACPGFLLLGRVARKAAASAAEINGEVVATKAVSPPWT